MRLLAEFALFLVAAFAAVLFVPRWLRTSRVPGRAGTAAVSPARERPASGGMAVPVAYVIEREPYDSGCILTGSEGGDGL